MIIMPSGVLQYRPRVAFARLALLRHRIGFWTDSGCTRPRLERRLRAEVPTLRSPVASILGCVRGAGCGSVGLITRSPT